MFVEAAPGFERTDKDGLQLLMKLGKNMFGLAQSPGNWWKTINALLITLEFVPLKSDICIYIYRENDIVIIRTLYLDDLPLVGADIQVIESIKRKLMVRFQMTGMGDFSLVLGMEVTRDRQNKTLTISQENCTKSVLEKFGMANCKPASTSGYGPELSTKQQEDTLQNEEEAQRSSHYGLGDVPRSNHKVRYHVQHLPTRSCYVEALKVNMDAAKYLLRYLAGTTDITLVYMKGGF